MVSKVWFLRHANDLKFCPVNPLSLTKDFSQSQRHFFQSSLALTHGETEEGMSTGWQQLLLPRALDIGLYISTLIWGMAVKVLRELYQQWTSNFH